MGSKPQLRFRWQCLCAAGCEVQMSMSPLHWDNSDSDGPGTSLLFPHSDHILLCHEAPRPIVSLLPPEFCSLETGGLEHSPLVWNTKLSVYLLTHGWTNNFFAVFKDIIITNITKLTTYCGSVNQTIKIYCLWKHINLSKHIYCSSFSIVS